MVVCPSVPGVARRVRMREPSSITCGSSITRWDWYVTDASLFSWWFRCHALSWPRLQELSKWQGRRGWQRWGMWQRWQQWFSIRLDHPPLSPSVQPRWHPQHTPQKLIHVLSPHQLANCLMLSCLFGINSCFQMLNGHLCLFSCNIHMIQYTCNMYT